MRPLKVALIVKNTPIAFERERRNMGIFSYATDEYFTWTHLTPQKYSKLDTLNLKHQGYDLIFHEDSNWCTYNHHALPVIFYSIDSTLSEEHYQTRLKQASQADLVLVDHDRLERFYFPHIPTRRLLYAVNDHLFKPATPKPIGVNFHCGGSPHRQLIRNQLNDLCKEKQWRYVSGVVDLYAYADVLGKSKIVVNVPRNDTNRPHRVMDSMACQTCLLSMPFPKIESEWFVQGYHYATFSDGIDLKSKLPSLFEDDLWQKIATQGYTHVMQNHTWRVRSRELRLMINEEFGI